jgi:plastocyanin
MRQRRRRWRYAACNVHGCSYCQYGDDSATIDAVPTTNFSPVSVTITANQIVQWNNAPGVAHTVTSTTVPANGTFNEALNNGTSACLKFTSAGAFNYRCNIHQAMTGLVTVNEN